MEKKRKVLGFTAVAILIVAAISRLLPHPDNVTPVASMALFGGAYFSRKSLAFIIPIAALFISDFVLNNTILRGFFNSDGIIFFSQYMIYGYIAFLLTSCIGIWFLKKISVGHVIIASLASSILFFLISNYGSYLAYLKSENPMSLMATYVAGLPFFRSTVLGNLLFAGIMFGSYEFFQRRIMVKQKA